MVIGMWRKNSNGDIDITKSMYVYNVQSLMNKINSYLDDNRESHEKQTKARITKSIMEDWLHIKTLMKEIKIQKDKMILDGYFISWNYGLGITVYKKRRLLPNKRIEGTYLHDLQYLLDNKSATMKSSEMFVVKTRFHGLDVIDSVEHPSSWVTYHLCSINKKTQKKKEDWKTLVDALEKLSVANNEIIGIPVDSDLGRVLREINIHANDIG